MVSKRSHRSVLFSLVLPSILTVTYSLSSSIDAEVTDLSSCASWFERNVLCDAIHDGIEWSMNLHEKDVTNCPDRCQTCKNYDANVNASEPFYAQTGALYDGNGNLYQDEEVHFDEFGNCYDALGNPLYKSDGTWAFVQQSALPWEMENFYEYVHCARDFETLPNIWKTGDSDKMYERIVTKFPQYSPTILSRPEYSEFASSDASNPDVGVGPWLVQLEDFLTDDECDEMIRQTKIAIHETEGYAAIANDEANEEGGACQSTQAWCDPYDCVNEPALQSAWKKIEELVDLPFHTHTEPVHFIQYVPGQKYGRHTDAIPEEYNSMTGPRIFTLLLYLNDIDESVGGQTCFPQIGRAHSNSTEPICVQPKKGRAVIWPNIQNEIPNGTVELPENRTWHEAHEITEGYKYASTIWYHLRNYSYVNDVGCAYVYLEKDRSDYDATGVTMDEEYTDDDFYYYDYGEQGYNEYTDDDSYSSTNTYHRKYVGETEGTEYFEEEYVVYHGNDFYMEADELPMAGEL